MFDFYESSTEYRILRPIRFHVGEDLITTMVTVLMAAQLRPELIDTRVQLVFADDYGMDANHFTPLWDRIGTWAPRRLTLDPWRKGECCESITDISMRCRSRVSE